MRRCGIVLSSSEDEDHVVCIDIPIPADDARIIEDAPIIDECAPIIEDAHIIDEYAPIIEEDAPIIDERTPIVEDDGRIIELHDTIIEDAAIVEENARIIDENPHIVEDDAHIIEENSHIANRPEGPTDVFARHTSVLSPVPVFDLSRFYDLPPNPNRTAVVDLSSMAPAQPVIGESVERRRTPPIWGRS